MYHKYIISKCAKLAMVEKLPQKIHMGFSLLGTIGGIIGFIILTCLGNIHAGKYISFYKN